MRKLIVLAVVLAVALTIVPAAFAGAGDGSGPGPGAGTATQARNVKYSLSGTVQAVDTDASTLSVLVKQANRRARYYRGDVVTVGVTAATRLYQRTVDGELVVIMLADFAAGDRIQSVGKLDKTDPDAPVFTAARVTKRPPAGTCTDCGG
jgi:hypothetical protein